MTVNQLILLLQALPGDLIVYRYDSEYGAILAVPPEIKFTIQSSYLWPHDSEDEAVLYAEPGDTILRYVQIR